MNDNLDEMSSERRINASRANGALSPGPKTPLTKLRSARNSLRHGLLARTIVLDDERSTTFKALLAELETQLQPRDQVEKSCIENMVVARWRMMRIWSMEKAGLQHEISKQEDGQDGPTRSAIAFRSLCDDSRSAELLNRYEVRYDRQYARALHLLLKWRDRDKLYNFSNDPSPEIEHLKP